MCDTRPLKVPSAKSTLLRELCFTLRSRTQRRRNCVAATFSLASRRERSAAYRSGENVFHVILTAASGGLGRAGDARGITSMHVPSHQSTFSVLCDTLVYFARDVARPNSPCSLARVHPCNQAKEFDATRARTHVFCRARSSIDDEVDRRIL